MMRLSATFRANACHAPGLPAPAPALRPVRVRRPYEESQPGCPRERSYRRWGSMAPYDLAEPFASVLPRAQGPSALFCHISWRQTHGGYPRVKRVKKATPRYVAGEFAPLCCVYSDFGGIRAILSGGNPPMI